MRLVSSALLAALRGAGTAHLYAATGRALSTLAGRLATDTHMSLLADRDFVNQQEAIDAALLGRVAS